MRFHHIGVAVPDLSKALPSYAALFGYRLISGPFDDPIQKVAVCFIGNGTPGEPMIELIAANAPDSPIRSILAQGGGAYHLCFETADIERALEQAQEAGSLTVSRPVPAVAFGGRRIAWFYTPTRQLIELVEAAEAL